MCEIIKRIQEEYLPVICRQLDYFWQISGERYLCCGKHAKAGIAGIFVTVFGLVVLSFDNVNTQPGTIVVRDKLFGIECYFLVYFNGLLLYLCLMLLMEDNYPAG